MTELNAKRQKESKLAEHKKSSVYAIEDRCSHDDGPLVEGTLDQGSCTVECPRHGSRFDLKTGRPLSLPAYEPVDTFPVIIENETIKLEVE